MPNNNDHPTGNRGEWSELYVFFELLNKGNLHAADADLNRLEDVYFPILEIIRDENADKHMEFVLGNSIEIKNNGRIVRSISKDEFAYQAHFLYAQIILPDHKDGSFSVPETSRFMKEIGIEKLKAPSADKADINMKVHDINTGYTSVCGWSVKSEIGSAPTLLNAGKTTNFKYQISGISPQAATALNEDYGDLRDRLSALRAQTNSIEFVGMQEEKFRRNLLYIDTRFPELLAAALKCFFFGRINRCTDVVDQLEHQNPLGFPIRGIYEYKFKKFLATVALGMKPATPWNGKEEANGGYIVVKASGEIVAYHLYNRDAFESYLLENTKFETASTSRHSFGKLYQENGVWYLDLNLQIRFIR